MNQITQIRDEQRRNQDQRFILSTVKGQNIKRVSTFISTHISSMVNVFPMLILAIRLFTS